MNTQHWQNLQNRYSGKDWSQKPSLFAQAAIEYFPKEGVLLELGAGVGQDSLFFALHSYDVTATDVVTEKLIARKAEFEVAGNITLQQVDLRKSLPFTDESYDIVYAHLSLHYFDKHTTEKLFSEIYRVLKNDGILAFFTNSTSDPDYGEGEKIEEDFFEFSGVRKRYLTPETAKGFARNFAPIIADNQGETYKDSAIGVHSLIRFIGRKTA